MQCNLYHAVCVCIYKNMFMQRKKRELNIWMILSFYLYIFFFPKQLCIQMCRVLDTHLPLHALQNLSRFSLPKQLFA